MKEHIRRKKVLYQLLELCYKVSLKYLFVLPNILYMIVIAAVCSYLLYGPDERILEMFISKKAIIIFTLFALCSCLVFSLWGRCLADFLYECAARVPVFIILAHTDAVWRGMLLFLAGSVFYLFLFEGLKISGTS